MATLSVSQTNRKNPLYLHTLFKDKSILFKGMVDSSSHGLALLTRDTLAEDIFDESGSRDKNTAATLTGESPFRGHSLLATVPTDLPPQSKPSNIPIFQLPANGPADLIYQAVDLEMKVFHGEISKMGEATPSYAWIWNYWMENKSQVFYAQENGKITGVGMLEPDDRDSQVGILMGVAVDPAHRRKGIGSQLLSERIRFAKEQGYAKVRLFVRHDNPHAIEMNTKLGFQAKKNIKAPSGFIQYWKASGQSQKEYLTMELDIAPYSI
ncbi:MAG: GNAT family N-acetyltransferase, partial [Cyanobacteria bacterium]|nr:GNAT family N-acetyltransferase [Cyanobacteriota bacterium]